MRGEESGRGEGEWAGGGVGGYGIVGTGRGHVDEHREGGGVFCQRGLQEKAQ